MKHVPVVLGILIFAATEARADFTIYNSFGEAYRPSQGFIVGKQSSSSNASMGSYGFQFSPSASGTVTSMIVAMNNASTEDSAPFHLSLYTDNQGHLGSLLGSWGGISTATPFTYGYGDLFSFVTAGGADVYEGSKYWLIATADLPNYSASLFWNSSSFVSGTPKYQFQDYPTGTDSEIYYSGAAPAVIIGATTIVPEPSSTMVAGTGVLLCLARRRR